VAAAVASGAASALARVPFSRHCLKIDRLMWATNTDHLIWLREKGPALLAGPRG
jgi:hypothetical protein